MTSGNLPSTGALASFDLTDVASTGRTIEAWFDGNSSGTPDDGEIVTLADPVRPKYFTVGPTAPNDVKEIYAAEQAPNKMITITMYGGSGTVTYRIKNAQGKLEPRTWDYNSGGPLFPDTKTVIAQIGSISVKATKSTKGEFTVENP